MDTELINKYIAISLAIKVFNQDLVKFKDFKLGNLYLDLLEAIIERLQNDFYKFKSELYTTHHLDIKRIGNVDGVEKYKVNNNILSFTPKELKELTKIVMSEYLSADKVGDFERKERI